MKHAFIIHGWDGKPENSWYPWLKQELEAKGYSVQVPQMPNPETPKIEEWVPHLRQIVGSVDSNTHFVCHSMGCQTLLRYLESVSDDVKIGGVLLVAPFTNLVNLEDPESEAVAKPWLETPIDWEKVRAHISEVLCLFSTDDPWVPVSEAGVFEGKLGTKTMTFDNQDHFIGQQLPLSIDEIVKLLS